MPSSPTTKRSASNLDADLIEAVPLALRKFHPGKGAVLVRMVEQVVAPPTKSNSDREKQHQPISTALTAGLECSNRRVLALGAKGLYLSDPDGTVVRVAVYDDVQRITTFQKYLYLSLASRQHAGEDDPILLCLSPFPENTRNNVDEVVAAVSKRCRSDVVVDRPSRSDILAAADVHSNGNNSSAQGLTASIASSSSMQPSRSFDASPLQSALSERFRPQPEEWRSILETLYAQHCPAKVPQVPLLLKEFHGQETSLLLGITKKYQLAIESILQTVEQCVSARSQQADDTQRSAVVGHGAVASPPIVEVANAVPSQAIAPSPPALPPPAPAPARITSLDAERPDDQSPTRAFVKAIEAASNATAEYEEHPEHLANYLSDEEGGAARYPEWGAQDNDVNMQWCPSYLEERIAAAALASIVDEAAPDEMEGYHSRGDDDAASHGLPCGALEAYDPLPGDATRSPQEDQMADDSGAATVAMVPTLDHAAMRQSPLWSGRTDLPLEEASPGSALVARRHIHVPSLEQARDAIKRMPQFEDVDELQAHAHRDGNDSAGGSLPGGDQSTSPMVLHRPFEVRSSSPRLLATAPVSGSARKASSLFGSRRTFGTGRQSSLTHDDNSLERGDDFSVERPLWEETTVDTARNEQHQQQQQSDVVHPHGNVAATSAYDDGLLSASLLESPLSVRTHTQGNASNRTEDNAAMRNEVDVRPSDARKNARRDWDHLHGARPNNFAALPTDEWLVGRGDNSSLFHDDEMLNQPRFNAPAPFSCFNASPASRRYFVAANATEALRMLTPERASAPHNVFSAALSASPTLSSAYQSPPHLTPIQVDELVRIAKRLVASNGSSSASAACQSAMDAYARWSAETQARCFVAFEALFEDAWSCDAFLKALAPLVGNVFESILLTLSLPPAWSRGSGASPSPSTSQQRRKLHCPRLMFAAFVGAWDARSRFVLKASSRHGRVVVENVALSFLEHLDRSSLTQVEQGASSMLAGAAEMPAYRQTPLVSRRFAAEGRGDGTSRVGSEPKRSFSDLWALGNVLVRVEHIPYSGSLKDADDAEAFDADRAVPASSSLPLAEWNDLVARWNAMQ